MTKTKPTPADPPPADPEVRASAPADETPATPGPGEAAAAIQREAADRLAATVAEAERAKAELAAARVEQVAATDRLTAEIDRLTTAMKAGAADAATAGAPAGTGWFEVSVPGCTLPKRVVPADTPAAAAEAYKALFGITSFAAGPVVAPVDPPAEAPPAS